MKTSRINQVLQTVSALCVIAWTAGAEEIVTNRLSFSARLGFNASARFKGLTVAPVGTPSTSRRTPLQPGRPDGDAYNYDNGYVLPDVATVEYGNNDGMTWYWGYDDSASQISDNTILLSRTTSTTGGGATGSFGDDPQLGCELTYNRFLGAWGDARYGLEVAANYLNLSMHASGTFAGSATRVTDAYPFTPGTTPPYATPPDTVPGPYQGSYEGPGFVIGGTPVSSSTVIVPGATVTDKRRFDGDLWGFRLGPYLEIPLDDPVNLSLSAGLAVGLLNADASWSQTSGSSSFSGSGSDNEVLWGGYVSAVLTWYLSERWSLVGGAQFQSLGDYEHSFGGREVEVDLSNSWFVTLGLSCKF
jgi:hypothetical protein